MSDGCWRVNEEFFKRSDECPGSAPGSVNVSPAWFEQARDVCGDMIRLWHLREQLSRDPRLNSGLQLRSRLEPKLREDVNGFLPTGNLLR